MMWIEDCILKMIGVASGVGLLFMVIWGLVVKSTRDVRKEMRASGHIIYRRDTPEWQEWAEKETQRAEEEWRRREKDQGV